MRVRRSKLFLREFFPAKFPAQGIPGYQPPASQLPLKPRENKKLSLAKSSQPESPSGSASGRRFFIHCDAIWPQRKQWPSDPVGMNEQQQSLPDMQINQ
jgi:hypothetical protein